MSYDNDPDWGKTCPYCNSTKANLMFDSEWVCFTCAGGWTHIELTWKEDHDHLSECPECFTAYHFDMEAWRCEEKLKKPENS